MSDTIKFSICPKCHAPIPAEAPQGLCPKCVLGGAASPTETGVAATATGEIPSIQRIAAAFPQLEILELIGRGGMGFVFKARQPHLDRFVALKLLPDKLASDPQFAERFNREGRFLAKLNHPNIVSVFDFGQAGGFYFLLMEYVDGVNLRQAMRAGRFSPAEALAIVPKICEALQYAHEQSVLHRDIKPENILLDAKGRVKIADFGIAKLVGEEHPDASLTATGAALGTMHYMAPEQIEKPSTVDHRADIYSLGVVFYELLTGELPLGRFGPPSEKTPVDSRVDDVVMRTLEKEREKRFQSAGEMGTTVEHLTEVGAGSYKGAPPKAPGAEPQRGPGGTMVINPSAVIPAVPKWSLKAVWGAVLVGISLVPLVVLLSFVAYFAAARRNFVSTSEVVLISGSLLFSLPAIAGTILGWMGLSDVSRGEKRGAVFAIFAALFWPVILLAAFTVWLVVAPIRNFAEMAPFASFLLLLVPAGTVTFIIWAIYTTVRKATGQPTLQSRGVLKWVFAALLVSGIAFVIATRLAQTSSPTYTRPVAPAAAATDTTPWIRFTFTAVELREGRGVRWLAIDYLDDVHGECQKAFPWETTIPGFKAETRTSEFLGGDTNSPVRHQRVEYQMPDSIRRDQLERLRDQVARTLNHKSFRLELGEEKLLFEMIPMANGMVMLAPPEGVATEKEMADVATGFGGSLKARIKVVPALKNSAGPSTASFGPEIETTVTNLFSGGAQLALDRQQGASLPPDGKQWYRDTLFRWLADEGVDLAVIDYDDENYGWGFVMRQTTSRIEGRTWQAIDPQVLQNSLARAETGLEKMDASRNGMGLYRVYPRLLPLSFAIRTSGGRLAAVQITGFTDNPRGVKIRYKLVRDNGTEADEIRIRLARDQLAVARQKMSVGLIGQEELADAERQFAVAEARGDAVAAARANLKFAETALTVAKKKFEIGVIPSSDLRIAESQHALAEIELKEALKGTKATPK